MFKRKPLWLMSTVVPSSLRLIRELNSRTKIELPKMRVFLGCKTEKYKMVFCISQWKSDQSLSTIEICSPVKLCNYRLVRWGSGILYEIWGDMSLTGLSSSIHLMEWRNAIRWDVRSEVLYSIVVWTTRTLVKCRVKL